MLWSAGLDRIPPAQYEAAAVDGANSWQMFRWITWPGLRPTLYLTALLSLINSFKVFREAYLVAGAVPSREHVPAAASVQQLVLNLELGRITAAAVLLVGGMLAVAGVCLAVRCHRKRKNLC